MVKRRFLSVLLSLCMVISMIPTMALAIGGDDGDTAGIGIKMNNLLLRTNQGTSLQYSLSDGMDEQKLTFTATDGVADVERNGDSWSVRYHSQGVSAGEKDTIQAWYEGQYIGSCEVLFVGASSKVTVDLQNESGESFGTSAKLPLGSTTRVYAIAEDTNISIPNMSMTQTGWEWRLNTAPEIASMTVDAEDSAWISLTAYQQDYVQLKAMPIYRIEDKEYVFSYTADKSFTVSGGMTASADAIWQGGSVTLTFELPQELIDKGVSVKWSSDNEAVLPVPQTTGTTVTAIAAQSSPIEGQYISVEITASAEVDGHIYTGHTSVFVWKVSISADKTVADWASLQEALQSGAETIAISDTITIPSGETLDLSGVKILRPDDNRDALFLVSEGNVYITASDASAAVMDGQYNGASAPLIEVTNTGNLTIENITLQNNTNSASEGQGGAVSVTGGSLNCTKVAFLNNTAQGNATSGNDYHGGGAIYATNALIQVDGCTFTKNTAMYGNGGAIYADQGTTGSIQNSLISECEAVRTKDSGGLGGGIYCRLAGDIMIANNTISNCQAEENGGGIAIITTGDISGTITLKDNDIQENSANGRGGGLYLVQDEVDTVDLQSGTISRNSASWGGGIDYTVHSQETLVLQNVLITENQAVRGAGVWACPTSETQTASTLGGAIYGNIASGNTQGEEMNPIYASGDDIRYEGKDADEHKEDNLILQGSPWFTDSTQMTVMKRALGGGTMQWYQDEQDDRYASGDAEANADVYTNTSQSFSLHGELSEAHQALATAEAKLTISGNTATSRGGGIATNSPIQIGMIGADKTVKVTKTWDNEQGYALPESIQVDLYRINLDTNERVLLDTATMTAASGWETEFTDLPACYLDQNGEQKDYSYDVIERPVSNWKAEQTSKTVSADGKTITIALTNTYVPDVITITPVDLTIYMGGDDGYDAVVGDGSTDATATNSLPKPIFELTASDGKTNLGGITFRTADGSREWKAVQIPKTDGTMSQYYALEAIKEGQDPVRVTYTDDAGNEHLSDSFNITAAKDLFETYKIQLYTGTVQTDSVTATQDGKTYTIALGEPATLTVRTVVDTDQNEAVTPVVNTAPTQELEPETGMIVADKDTVYTVNDLGIPMPADSAPSLLFDEIVTSDGTDREQALEDEVSDQVTTASDRTRYYQSRYLDLVDADNGNIWLTANKNITVYWAYPEGTSANDDFTLWHFEGLHRDGANSGFDINDIDSTETKLTQVTDIQKGEYGISFTVVPGGFSPYVLTWTRGSGGSSSGGSTPKPDDLNTEDHFAYIIGYPKDYQTGEPTRDESRWPIEPKGDITRAEVATIFFRMLTDEARSTNWSQTNAFTDVASTDWYNNAISTLANMEILSGDPDGSFRPNDSITRAEFTKIAVSFFDEAGSYVDGTYADVPANAWYADFIDAAVDLGLIEGYPDGTIHPETSITRAEACTIVNRTLGRVPDKDHLLPTSEMRVWPDNADTGAWYYAQMQEATNSHDYEWTGAEDNQIENWTEKLEDRDWEALEKEWSDANSAPGGEVMD